MKPEIKIRNPSPEDIPFIYATWLNSYCHDSALGKSVRNSVFHKEYKEVIDRIIQNSQALIACHTDDPNVLFGYLIYSDGVAHYSFVKEAFRRFGIAKELLKESNLDIEKMIVTHKTFYLAGMNQQFNFNPFGLFKK